MTSPRARLSAVLTALAACAAVACTSCSKSTSDDNTRTTTAPAPGAAAPAIAAPATAELAADARRVPIDVGKRGYEPSSVEAKPGEQLGLVFTRTADTECGRWVVVGDDKRELPMNEPVLIAVTAPADGTLEFACGMNMMRGAIVVN